jgi:putative selenium metabolism protein SsnA
MKAITNATIYDYHSYQEDMYILFDQQIIEVGKMSDFDHQVDNIIDVKHQLVLPGFVNCHSHIYSTLARGVSVPFNPNNFKEILEQLWWKVDRNLDHEATYYSAIVNGVDYLKHGVTTIVDHHASGEILGSLQQLKKALTNDIGIRNILCFESSDRFPIDDCIKENASFIKENHTDMNSGLFGLHAAFSLSDQSLQKIADNLQQHPIHIHVAESIFDQEYSIKTYNKRVIERLDSFQLITPGSIITHGIHLSDQELEIIRKRDAYIALNVTSNMNNAVGLPNYFKMKEHGVKVLMGNDGINVSIAQELQNLYYAMHHVAQDPRTFTFDDLRQIIHQNYAYVSNILQTKLGKIEAGYQADFVVMEYMNPSPTNQDNIFSHLFFGLFGDFTPQDVFVKGKHLVQNYRVDNKLEIKYQEASQVAKKLWDRIQKEEK